MVIDLAAVFMKQYLFQRERISRQNLLLKNQSCNYIFLVLGKSMTNVLWQKLGIKLWEQCGHALLMIMDILMMKHLHLQYPFIKSTGIWVLAQDLWQKCLSF